MNRLPLLFLVFATALNSGAAWANSEYEAWRNEASTFYEQGNYPKAFKQFVKLGKKGDRFSQFRVSYMTLKGLGTRPDVIESLAWAALAAHNGPGRYSSYQDTVAALVPEKQRGKAEQKVDYYLRRWGDLEQEEDRKHLEACTGSRLAALCNPDESLKTWINWNRESGREQDLLLRIDELSQSIEHEATVQQSHETGD